MPQALPQIRNQEQNRILSADFQPRYEPNFGWKSLASSLQGLPMLRGAWLASVNAGGQWHSISGLNKLLTRNGNPLFNYSGLAPYWDLDGVGDYFNRADEADLDITGTETYVASAAQGLTFGGWFNKDTIVNLRILMAKTAFTAPLANQRSYALYVNNAQLSFLISSAGTAASTVTAGPTTNTISAATWFCAIARFDPSNTMDIFLDGVKTSLAAGVPASCFNSTAPFELGCYDNGDTGGFGGFFDGNVSCCFLCAAALSDASIQSFYEQSRAIYGG